MNCDVLLAVPRCHDRLPLLSPRPDLCTVVVQLRDILNGSLKFLLAILDHAVVVQASLSHGVDDDIGYTFTFIKSTVPLHIVYNLNAIPQSSFCFSGQASNETMNQ